MGFLGVKPLEHNLSIPRIHAFSGIVEGAKACLFGQIIAGVHATHAPLAEAHGGACGVKRPRPLLDLLHRQATATRYVAECVKFVGGTHVDELKIGHGSHQVAKLIVA